MRFASTPARTILLHSSRRSRALEGALTELEHLHPLNARTCPDRLERGSIGRGLQQEAGRRRGGWRYVGDSAVEVADDVEPVEVEVQPLLRVTVETNKRAKPCPRLLQLQ